MPVALFVPELVVSKFHSQRELKTLDFKMTCKVTCKAKQQSYTHFSIRSLVSSSIARGLSEDEEMMPNEPRG